MLALLLSLKGTALLYQGEELGLTEADLRRDQLKDPVGDLYYPLHKGRDGCRTPMPWDAQRPNFGFTTGSPWLPLSPDHRALAVSEQADNANSTLAFARRFLAQRRTSAALRHGDIAFRDGDAQILAFERGAENERVLCAFNMSAKNAVFQDSAIGRATALDIGRGSMMRGPGTLELEPYGVWLGRL
jgi:alpha-glucosidase